jgi:hypothetical protein
VEPLRMSAPVPPLMRSSPDRPNMQTVPASLGKNHVQRPV